MNFLEDGGTLAGSSAGAMVLGGKMYFHGRWIDALGLLPRVVVLPHHRKQDTTGEHPWKGTLGKALIFSIPEATACLTSDGKTWRIAGERDVAVYSDSDEFHYQPGQEFELI
jgi:cyanophycinase-like exopeptidase